MHLVVTPTCICVCTCISLSLSVVPLASLVFIHVKFEQVEQATLYRNTATQWPHCVASLFSLVNSIHLPLWGRQFLLFVLVPFLPFISSVPSRSTLYTHLINRPTDWLLNPHVARVLSRPPRGYYHGHSIACSIVAGVCSFGSQ
jgi:hypothetical protein